MGLLLNDVSTHTVTSRTNSKSNAVAAATAASLRTQKKSFQLTKVRAKDACICLYTYRVYTHLYYYIPLY